MMCTFKNYRSGFLQLNITRINIIMLLLKDLPITCIDMSKLHYNCYDSMSYSLRDILNSLYSQLFHIKENIYRSNILYFTVLISLHCFHLSYTIVIQILETVHTTFFRNCLHTIAFHNYL